MLIPLAHIFLPIRPQEFCIDTFFLLSYLLNCKSLLQKYISQHLSASCVTKPSKCGFMQWGILLTYLFSFFGSHRPGTQALSVFHPSSSHQFSHKDIVQELIPERAPCFSRDTFPRISQMFFCVMKTFTFSCRGWSAHCFLYQEHFSAIWSIYLDTTFYHNSRLLMDCDLSCPDVSVVPSPEGTPIHDLSVHYLIFCGVNSKFYFIQWYPYMAYKSVSKLPSSLAYDAILILMIK